MEGLKVSKEAIVKGIVPAIEKLQADQSWRVRVSVIEGFEKYAKVLGEKEFMEALGKYCEKWFKEPAFAVREAGVIMIKKLITVLGYDWAKTYSVIEKLLELKNHTNYLYRVVPLLAFEQLIEVIPEEEMKTKYAAELVEFLKDKVPNIRMMAVKCLIATAKKIKNGAAVRGINNALSGLENDKDQDVRKAAMLRNNNSTY